MFKICKDKNRRELYGKYTEFRFTLQNRPVFTDHILIYVLM